MSNIVPFAFEGNPVRVVDRDGEPWFVAKDIAVTLGYTNPRKAIRDHCKAYVPVGGTDRSPLGLDPQTLMIPERDVYRLIVKSALPKAQEFEEWLFGTVLPQIRKTGGYGKPALNVRDPAQSAAIVQQYQEWVAELQPKAAVYDRIAGTTKDEHSRKAAAQYLQMREKDLTDWLRDNRWIQKDAKGHWVLYAGIRDKGFAVLKMEYVPNLRSDVPVIFVTGRGIAEIGMSVWRDEPGKLYPLLAQLGFDQKLLAVTR